MIAYVLVTLAAITRTLTPVVTAANLTAAWTIAGVLWIAAFALYLVVYAPILSRPRLDGRPG
ncbi:MAG: hypothetical protein GTO67_13315 [Gammaproteobacteria bacterium]|nr:hypothetical protein [Gammaproteobacteria bacterium]NIN39547.1 hypothetical protein [Gammaproteobacteria bacterium]NIO25104.1 hypothetical protein [Gammaproteobacteria bacterium]NIO65733.1 hypothetical protein [Gammaproteobacteria bacterium]NIP64622.1 hypothetical protein [Gammaproteobacteria bacterium]